MQIVYLNRRSSRQVKLSALEPGKFGQFQSVNLKQTWHWLRHVWPTMALFHPEGSKTEIIQN